MSAEHSLGPVCMARIAPSIALVCLLVHMAAANSQTAGTRQRSHRVTVTSSPFTYTVTVGGTMDGLNTRGPIGYQVFHQKFEPNIELILENAGDTVVRNPWIKIDGRGGWQTIDDMLAEALEPGMTDAEKARAMFEFERKHRFHASTYDREVRDVVKALNCYGYTLCFDDSKCIAQLWRAAGLKTRRGWPYGHSVTEVFYDGAWHLLDGDEHGLYLLRDNRTVASEAQVAYDHDLIKRTHTYGPIISDNRMRDEGSAALFYYDGPRCGDWPDKSTHKMHFVLRPGEKIVWKWSNRRRYHGLEDIGKWKRAWTRICNGYFEYSPDLGRGSHRKFLSIAGAKYSESKRALTQNDPAKPAVVELPVRSCWPIVGGWLELTADAPAGTVRVEVAKYGNDRFSKIWSNEGPLDSHEPARIDLDPIFPPTSPACYRYRLRIVLLGRSADRHPPALRGFTLRSTVQMAWLAMPALACGENHVLYKDDNDGPRKVIIEHRWQERSDSAPPPPPPEPIFPKDGQTVRASKFTFRWAEPASSEPIVDYWFELSDRPDMRWPLSPNFEKLISRTAQRHTASYEIPYEGLLNPNQTYYWRVRAKNASGVWSAWSKTWSFRIACPAPPINLKLTWDERRRALILSWQPNPMGEKPAKYIVYGSDEQGFTVSDKPYKVNCGIAGIKEFPPNRIAETTSTSIVVAGQACTLANGNRMFYRVVAVSADGIRSGPSDMVQADRPIIYTPAPQQIPYGRTTTVQMRALASIGDLRSRAVGSKAYQTAFGLNADRLQWAVHSDVLASIDPQTGLLQITPSIWDLGPAEFIVQCTNQRGQRDYYRFTILIVAPEADRQVRSD